MFQLQKRRLAAWFALAALAGLAAVSAQTISVTDLSSTFHPIITPTGAIMTDPFNDQQTGQKQSDFVSFTAGTSVYINGSATPTTVTSDVPGFMMKAGQIAGDTTNTYLMFRFTFHDSNQSKNYQGSYVMLGVDLTGDGKPDIIFGVNATNTTQLLDFLKPGTGLNDAPNTTTATSYTTTAATTLTSGTTVAYAAAATTYDNVASSKAQNMNLTFAISYANLQQAIRDMGTVNGTNFSTFTLTSSTTMAFLAYTSQQDNAFNQDIYGGNITSTASATWTSLGAFSTTFTADGVGHPIPEASTWIQTMLLLGTGGGLTFWRRRRRHAATMNQSLRPAPAGA